MRAIERAASQPRQLGLRLQRRQGQHVQHGQLGARARQQATAMCRQLAIDRSASSSRSSSAPRAG